MITIEHLEVLFDAERERDEAVFAELFAAHMARHERLGASAASTSAGKREADRPIDRARCGW